jgi:DNA replication protein DnaC
MNEALQEKLHHLRLNRLAAHWEEDLKAAARQRLSHAALLTHVIEEEYRVKCDKAIMALYDTLDFIPKAQNIVWLGGTGVGKTGLATSFLIRAIQQGCSGRYVLFAELITQLYHSVADHSQERLLRKYINCDILQIDELGYIETEPVQVGLFFTLMQRRHKKKPTLITSNLGFREWGSFLKNGGPDRPVDRMQPCLQHA